MRNLARLLRVGMGTAIALLANAPLQAAEPLCSNVFTGAVGGVGTGSLVDLKKNSDIFTDATTGQAINASTLTVGSHVQCDSGTCTKTTTGTPLSYSVNLGSGTSNLSVSGTTTLSTSAQYNQITIASGGKLILNGNTTLNIKNDFTAQDQGSGSIQVNGNVVIHADNFILGKNMAITIASGGSLTLYINNELKLSQNSKIDTGGKLSNFVVLAEEITNEDQGSGTYEGVFYATDEIKVGKNANFTGTLASNEIVVEENATVTYMGAGKLGAANIPGCTESGSTLTIADASTTEGNSASKSLTFTVTLNPAASGDVTASYTLGGGTATGGASCTAGVDYINTSGTVSVASGATTGTFNVSICVDTTYEANETFTVTLSSPSGAVLGTPSSATGTIVNDDSTGGFTIAVSDFKAGDGTTGTITAPQSGGAPVTGFASTVRKLKFYRNATNPTTSSGTMKMDAYEGATNTTASVGTVATSAGAAVVVDVYFDAAGVGRFDLNFDNVGQYSLFADWSLSDDTAAPLGTPATITGNDPFVVTPYRFDVLAKVGGTTVSSAAGGSAFDLTVTAQALCGKAGWGYTCPGGSTYTTATNFGGGAASDVSLSVTGSGLTNVPNFWCASTSTPNVICSTTAASGLTVQAGAFTNGVYTLSGVQWSEVGAATLTATSAYQGTASASNAGNTVNFYPERFAPGGTVTSSSGSFVYYGHDGINVAQTIAAQVKAPGGTYSTTQNYAPGAYSGTLATVQFAATNTATNSAVNVFPNVSVATGTQLNGTNCTWILGVCGFNTATGTLARATSPAVPVDVKFTVTITDTENKVAACTPSVVTATCTGPTSGNVFTADFGSINARYGRIAASNAYGSELLALTAPLTAQYYNAAGTWVSNTLDNTSNKATTTTWTHTPTGPTNLSGTGASGSSTVTLGGATVGGQTTLSASAPGAGAKGYVDATITVPAYLRFPWSGGATATNPGARFSFGIYNQLGSSKRIIHRREVR